MSGFYLLSPFGARTEKAYSSACTSATFLPFQKAAEELHSIHLLTPVSHIHNQDVSVENPNWQKRFPFFYFRLAHKQRRLSRFSLRLPLLIPNLQSNSHRPRCAGLPRRRCSPRSLSTPSPCRPQSRHSRLPLSRRIRPLRSPRRALRNPLARLER